MRERPRWVCKFRVEGADAEAVLQRISANDVAVPPGRIVYTQCSTRAAASKADRPAKARRGRSRRLIWRPSTGLLVRPGRSHQTANSRPLTFNNLGEASYEAQRLGHSKIESTVRYLGIEVDDAIEIAEKIDI